jgi:serine/threonine-protein kinase RsbT
VSVTITSSSTELPIVTEDDLVAVRRRIRELAHRNGLDSFATVAITTAVSELARNVLVHAKRGTAMIEEVENNTRKGIRIAFRDQGPGISDIDRVLIGGFSTAKSLGLGLSGSKRLVDDFQIDSRVGQGTVVTVTKWARF